MLYYLAFGVLALLIVLLAAAVGWDIHKRGRVRWLRSLKEWQGLIGTIVGFLGGAGVLVLSTGLANQQAETRAANEAYALGSALAFEAEHMSVPFEMGYRFSASIDMTSPVLMVSCTNLVDFILEELASGSPIFDAAIGRTADFGASDLALFVRFHNFYETFARRIRAIPLERCNSDPAQVISEVNDMVAGGLGYYGLIRISYPDLAPFGPPETSN